MTRHLIFAASTLAVFALAVPAHADWLADKQFALDKNACIAQGAGPDTDKYLACILQRKIDRYQQTRRRAAEVDAAAKSSSYRVSSEEYFDPATHKPVAKSGPLPDSLAVLSPMPRPASVPAPQVTLSVTKTKVCSTEGDAANPQTDCQTNVEVTKKAAQPPPQPDTVTDHGSSIDDNQHF